MQGLSSTTVASSYLRFLKMKRKKMLEKLRNVVFWIIFAANFVGFKCTGIIETGIHFKFYIYKQKKSILKDKKMFESMLIFLFNYYYYYYIKTLFYF